MLAAQVAHADDGAAQLAKDIRAAARVNAGLCVHIGCGTGELTAELARTGNLLVHGLEPDPGLVERARSAIQAQGLYGLASVQQCSLKALPYGENLVNLIVVDDLGKYVPPPTEVMRVLCPRGVALVGQSAEAASRSAPITAEQLRQALRGIGVGQFEIIEKNGVWARIEKPVPEKTDEWTHSRYDASGNAVSQDTLVGFPRRVRWLAGPVRAVAFQLSTNGRNFYAGIIARDAHNGLLLWKRSVSPTIGSGGGRPVAVGDRLFVVDQGKLLALDAATGETARTYDEAGTPTEIYYDRGILVTIDTTSIRALDAESGKLLWRRSASIPGCIAVGDGAVFYVDGNPRRGEQCSIRRVDQRTGSEVWRQMTPRFRGQPEEYGWITRATKSVYHDGLLAFEISTFADFNEGSSVQVVSAEDGKYLWEHEFLPSGHYSQARSLFAQGLLWVRHGATCRGLNPLTGEIAKEYRTAGGHCYPPVATTRYYLSGELHFTDLRTGELDAHRIVKGACDRSTGFMPANGLLYVTPKHCVCWPMLKGFAALAPALPGQPTKPTDEPSDFLLEKGPAYGRVNESQDEAANDWPSYRRDEWRSASTPMSLPTDLEVLWEKKISGWPENHLASEWEQNLFTRGPVTGPVVANGTAFVALPDQHQLLALDADTGDTRWRFTANGRIDTPPTIHDGLCLFGTRTGWVYCLSAKDGALLWRLRAAPNDQQIVAYGQIESPWPIAGSVLVVDGTVYCAAGRQYLADGGIRIFALDPPTGEIKWISRADRLPEHRYYGASGLEFDDYDLMVREGDLVSMSRWQFDRATGEPTIVPKSGFGRFDTGEGGVMAPRGLWSYGPRMGRGADRIRKRSLMVFRGNVLIGCTADRRGLFRRDFALDDGEEFSDEWFNYRLISKAPETGADTTRSQRLQHGAKWLVEEAVAEPICAMVLAGDVVFVATEDGAITACRIDDGRQLADYEAAAPAWDGMVAAYQHLYLTTRDGALVCLGAK